MPDDAGLDPRTAPYGWGVRGSHIQPCYGKLPAGRGRGATFPTPGRVISLMSPTSTRPDAGPGVTCAQPGCDRTANLHVVSMNERSATCRRCAGSVIHRAAANGETALITTINPDDVSLPDLAPPPAGPLVTSCSRPGCHRPADMKVRAVGGLDTITCSRCAGAVIRDTADGCGAIVDIVGLSSVETRRWRAQALADPGR